MVTATDLRGDELSCSPRLSEEERSVAPGSTRAAARSWGCSHSSAWAQSSREGAGCYPWGSRSRTIIWMAHGCGFVL